jgi:endonuclease G
VYSEKLQQPKWVEYKVLCTDGTISRKGLDFYPVNGIITSTNEDYENNAYDKGHLAPAADFNCNKENLKQSFSYLNCTLQHEKLNRGTWRLLESHERELAKTNTVSVQIRMNYSKNSKVLTTGATIPDSFTKIITYGNKKEKYFFKNEEPKSSDYNNYKVK